MKKITTYISIAIITMCSQIAYSQANNDAEKKRPSMFETQKFIKKMLESQGAAYDGEITYSVRFNKDHLCKTYIERTWSGYDEWVERHKTYVADLTIDWSKIDSIVTNSSDKNIQLNGYLEIFGKMTDGEDYRDQNNVREDFNINTTTSRIATRVDNAFENMKFLCQESSNDPF